MDGPGRYAIGASAGALALSWAACGFSVVVDARPSTGGHPATGGATTTTSVSTGGAGVTTGSTGGAGGAGGSCSPSVKSPDFLEMACFQSSYCPAVSSQSAKDGVNMALGLCDPSNTPCCGVFVLSQVVCGNEFSSGNCCYTVIVTTKTCG